MTAIVSLLNRQVSLSPSDPWDFVTANGSAPRTGVVLHEESGVFLVQLDEPVMSEDGYFQFVVVSARFEGESLAAAAEGTSVSCNVIGVSDKHATAMNPCDVSDYRGGGVAFIATFSLAPHSVQAGTDPMVQP